MLLSMAKVQIIGTKRCLDQTVRVLHRLGVLQIEELTKGGPFLSLQELTLDGDALKQREELSYLIARLEAVLALLPPQATPLELDELYNEHDAQDTHELISHVKDCLREVTSPAQELATLRDDLEAEKASLPRYEATLRKLMPLAAELMRAEGFETVAILIERRYRSVLDVVRQELQHLIPDRFELVSGDVDQETTGAIISFPRDHSPEVQSLLGRENITQVRLPEELARVSFKDALTAIARRQAAISEELEEIDRRLGELSAEWHQRLTVWRAVLRDRLQELEVIPKLGSTRYTFVIEGWVPRRDLDAIQEALQKEVGDQVILEELEVGPEEWEHAPVVLRNPAPIRPFELLVKLLALPRYGTLDPTPLMALFLPIFFGMILGDIAYGFVVLLLAVYLMRKYRGQEGGLQSLAQIMIPCSLWGIAFGFLYGEFLGTLGETLGLHPILDRARALVPFLAFSVAVGVVHVFLGLILGIWGAFMERRRKEFGESLGKLVALIALFLLVAVTRGFLPQAFFTPVAALLVIGLVILMASLGGMGVIMGPIELLGTVGNILSYMRIAAIGLSSVYLAEVANEMAGLLGNIVVGVIVAGLFHVLNIALGILGGTIQPLRLHYVEFFTKFFQSGGEGFAPFKRQGITESK